VNIWPPPSANAAISTGDKRRPVGRRFSGPPTGGGTFRWTIRRDHDAPHNGWMLLVQQLLDPAKHAPQHPGIGARQPHR
jgi:hypothetical protein